MTKSYRIYFLQDGRITGATWIDSTDDEAAVARAAKHLCPDAYEVWEGKRRIYPASPAGNGRTWHFPSAGVTGAVQAAAGA